MGANGDEPSDCLLVAARRSIRIKRLLACRYASKHTNQAAACCIPQDDQCKPPQKRGAAEKNLACRSHQLQYQDRPIRAFNEILLRIDGGWSARARLPCHEEEGYSESQGQKSAPHVRFSRDM